MTPVPGHTSSTPGRGSNTSIAVAASIPIRKMASLWYVSGWSPKPVGRFRTTARSCARVRTRTEICSLSSLNVLGRASSSSRLISAAVRSELSITLPLAMYVDTFAWPCDSRSSRRAAIGTLFRPPTLIPRSRTR